MRPARLGAAGVSLCGALLLAGCAQDLPTPSPSATTASPAPSFPAVDGPLLSSTASDVEWTRVVRVPDAETAYRQARSLLVDGGFTLTKDREGTGGGDGQACTTELCVGFTATEPDGRPQVAYDVFHPQGIVG